MIDPSCERRRVLVGLVEVFVHGTAATVPREATGAFVQFAANVDSEPLEERLSRSLIGHGFTFVRIDDVREWCASEADPLTPLAKEVTDETPVVIGDTFSFEGD